NASVRSRLALQPATLQPITTVRSGDSQARSVGICERHSSTKVASQGGPLRPAHDAGHTRELAHRGHLGGPLRGLGRPPLLACPARGVCRRCTLVDGRHFGSAFNSRWGRRGSCGGIPHRTPSFPALLTALLTPWWAEPFSFSGARV